ncbi:MAG: hypothetical protein LBE27_02040 [Deltaproteobacteria bacterium]|jgi:hypothetical protein|nr:hypothetical protein [Deltaproteobacteria bacterium]
MEPTTDRQVISHVLVEHKANKRFSLQKLSKVLVSICMITFMAYLYAGPIIVQVDMFSAYLEGRERAIEQNWRDLQRYQQYQQMQRNQIIIEAKRLFLSTGDYGYLCTAASYGDEQSMRILYNENRRCVFR